MKTLIIISLVLGFYSLSWGQNLVPNPSFEDTTSCPTGAADLSIFSWYSPTTASPDFFHTCHSGNVGAPQNGFGWQNPRTGFGYVGVHTSDFLTTNYREYIQCQLNSELEAGELYIVSFFVSRTDSSTKACDNIGAYLSSNSISSTNNLNLQVSPQVVSPQNNPITDDEGWTQIADTITAIGGEQFITLGVFSDNSNTNWINVSGGWEAEAHYYIDDVSIIKLSANSIHEHTGLNIRIYPNPSTDRVKIEANEEITQYSLYSFTGQLLITESHLTVNDSPVQIVVSDYTTGVYFLDLKINNEVIRKKIIIN